MTSKRDSVCKVLGLCSAFFFFPYKTGLTTSQFLHLVFNRRNVICSKAGEEKADLLTNRTVLFSEMFKSNFKDI